METPVCQWEHCGIIRLSGLNIPIVFQLITKIMNVQVEDLKTWDVKTYQGEDYLFHSPEQWNGVLLICTPYKDGLVITDTYYKGKEQPEEKIATVYGRFIEVLLVHFKDSFSHIEIHK